MRGRAIWEAIRETFVEWRRDNAQRLSAAIAFYTIFSISPLLVIAIAIAGRFLGAEAVRGEIVAQFGFLIGHEAAKQLETMIRGATDPKANLVASVLGIATMILGATGVFTQLKDALNTVWRAVPPRRSGIWSYVRTKLLSLAMVMGVAFLLLVSLVVSAAVSGLARWAEARIPAVDIAAIEAGHFVVSFVMITLLFAAIYKVLPDVKIALKDVWVGAAATALLFNIGKYLIGLYLGRASVASGYGAAGSLVVLLIWIYYSTSLFLLGAEFTQVYASRWGSRIRSRGEDPANRAVGTGA